MREVEQWWRWYVKRVRLWTAEECSEVMLATMAVEELGSLTCG